MHYKSIFRLFSSVLHGVCFVEDIICSCWSLRGTSNCDMFRKEKKAFHTVFPVFCYLDYIWTVALLSSLLLSYCITIIFHINGGSSRAKNKWQGEEKPTIYSFRKVGQRDEIKQQILYNLRGLVVLDLSYPF